MPHKRNPVNCEQICGLARLVRSNMQAAYENIALWHERDISHSSVERIILPDSTILVDYMLAQDDPDHGRRDARVSRSACCATWKARKAWYSPGSCCKTLVEKGMPRDDAYKVGAGKRHGGVGNGNEFSRARGEG